MTCHGALLCEEGRYTTHRCIIEEKRARPRSTPAPDVSDLDRCHAGPLAARHGSWKHTSSSSELVKTDLAGVALGDGVRGDQPEATAIPEQLPGSKEEVGAEIGTASPSPGEPPHEVL